MSTPQTHQPQHTTENHQALLNDINEKLKRLMRRDDGLWDAQDIADYLRMSKKSVQTNILPLKAFPVAILLENRARRWKAGEVRSWATRHRESKR